MKLGVGLIIIGFVVGFFPRGDFSVEDFKNLAWEDSGPSYYKNLNGGGNTGNDTVDRNYDRAFKKFQEQ